MAHDLRLFIMHILCQLLAIVVVNGAWLQTVTCTAVIQRRALKMILHLEWHTSSSCVFQQSKALQIDDLYNLHDSAYQLSCTNSLMASFLLNLMNFSHEKKKW